MEKNYEEKIYKKIKTKKDKQKIRELIYVAGQIIPITYIILISYFTTVFFMRYIAERHEADFIKYIIENGLSGITHSFIVLSFGMFFVLFFIGIYVLLCFKTYLTMKQQGFKPSKSKFERLINIKQEKKQDAENNDKYRY